MKISVIMPVYNEEKAINPALEALGRIADGAAYEAIVADGAPGTGTLKAVNVQGAIKIASPSGRARQMNAGAAAASGETLVFLHADTSLPSGAFKKIEEALRDPVIAGGAFKLRIDTKNPFIKFIAFTANIRTILWRMPYGDQALFFRKKYFEGIGGYGDLPFLEDVEIMRRVRARGGKIAVLDAEVLTSARRWEKEGVVYTTLRNKLVMLLYKLGVRPGKLARCYK